MPAAGWAPVRLAAGNNPATKPASRLLQNGNAVAVFLLYPVDSKIRLFEKRRNSCRVATPARESEPQPSSRIPAGLCNVQARCSGVRWTRGGVAAPQRCLLARDQENETVSTPLRRWECFSNAGEVAGKSTLICAPRLSSRPSAARAMRVVSVCRFRNSD